MTGLQPHGSPTPSRIAPLVGDNAVPPTREFVPVSKTDTARMPRLTCVDVVVAETPAAPPASGPVAGYLSIYEPIKYCFDFAFGCVLLILSSPIILIAALAVRVTSSGPAFYSQTRLGKAGRPFRIYKLRTMYHNCESATGAKWSVPGDSRITPLGKFLRVTHLDELPQLINVLKCEMSLVGPRPERPEIIKTLEVAIPRYRERLAIRPGVTGLAQLRLPADITVEGVREKLVYDLHYIQVMGPWLDIRLTACTIFKMTKLPLNAALSFFRVPGDRSVETTRQLLSVESA